jgi:DNA helicase II / ATP-dependent DNA helicase PcrA
MTAPGEPRPAETDPELTRVVDEEERCLARVQEYLGSASANRAVAQHDAADYDARLLDLRDQIASARMEDVPPLVQEMERLQLLAQRLREVTETEADPRSPYFGRLVLEENGRQREVLIGRGTHLDSRSDIRIVDWRDAPVSRLFYRYDEGDDYDEVFGGREVSGTVRVRRSLAIVDGVLRRIVAPQGTFARSRDGAWRRLGETATRLQGGAGSAIRAEQHHRPGKLGTRNEGAEDKQLKEITPLIDRRQFELITRPDSGLVVIQGGAGSGKTTIGLHRLAYLAFQDPRRFRPDRMLVIVFNTALSRYIAGVLPALGVSGVSIRTYEDWAHRLRHALFPRLPEKSREDTPSVITRLKKHPAMLGVIDRHVQKLAGRVDRDVAAALDRDPEHGAALLDSFRKNPERPLAHRLHQLSSKLEGAEGRTLTTDARVALERALRVGLELAKDVFSNFAEMVTDRQALGRALEELAPGAFREGELDRAHGWCVARVSDVLEAREQVAERAELARQNRREAERDRDGDANEGGRKPSARRGDDDDDEREEASRRQGVDGQDVDERAGLDAEDDALLLRLSQRLRGPLTRGVASKEPLIYEHVLIDEAQDMSPVELAVVLDTVRRSESVTLAGDVQQRLLLDNGFTDWDTVLGELGLSHVQVEPLKLSYRSTAEILEFSREVLGPLKTADAPQATRTGAPVELFGFAHTGDAVAFLAEALRELMSAEPQAAVAVIARFPEQADAYYDGLFRGEVPKLRRIADQDFPFKPGIDVTDVRQVKGLEFDYVVLVEANEGSYPSDDESRHLLHIGATRAAHQLWVVCSGKPSPILPRDLIDRSL